MKKHIIYECGICGSYHPWDFNGDCRDNANRFVNPVDYVERKWLTHEEHMQLEVRCMCERIEADGLLAVPCPMCGRTDRVS